MKTRITLGVIFFLFFGLSHGNQERQKHSCMSDELYRCVVEYIDKNKWNMPTLDMYSEKEGETIGYSNFYTAFFFEKYDGEYFTLWKSYWYPKDWLNEVKGSFSYLYYNVEGKDFFIVIQNKKNNPLFSICSESLELGEKKQDEDYIPAMYSGSLFPVTYKYKSQDRQIFIEKLDSTILDFSPGWAEYENLIQREKERKRER